MAPRLNRWLGVALGAMVLIALWALPPRSWESWYPYSLDYSREYSPETQAFREVAGEVNRLGAIYQRLEWNRLVEALADTVRAGEVGFLARVPDSAPPDAKPEIEEAIGAQLRRSGVESPTLPVGAVLLPRRYGVHPDFPWPSSWGSNWELFVNREEDKSFCFVVDPNRSTERSLARMLWTGPDSSLVPNPLGPCILHAKYGNPGDGVFSWLRSGGYALAEGSLGSWIQMDMVRTPSVQRRFGTRLSYPLSPGGASCVMGDRDVCLRLFRGAAEGEYGGYARPDYPWGAELWDSGIFPVAYRNLGSLAGMGLGGVEARLLYDLEEEFGEERFRAFWTSDQDVEEAFRAAFGVPVEGWMVGWAQAHWGKLELGPTIPLQATLLSFLSIGMCVGLALYMGRRRA
jgi:hypothetical protein